MPLFKVKDGKCYEMIFRKSFKHWKTGKMTKPKPPKKVVVILIEVDCHFCDCCNQAA